MGGIADQIPLIIRAKELGLYVITCDNRPDNPGHQLSDEYHNISITSPEEVFSLAKELNVDAVVNYVLEAGLQSAAYAQEQLGKPTSPYESVHILSNKNLFRKFLKDNGFNVPKVYNPTDENIEYPVVVKPADLWGSRGFTKVNNREELQPAIDYAMANSLHGEIIIEQFIEPYVHPIEGDGFAVDGVFKAHGWSDCYSDADAPNAVTPVAFCYPSEASADALRELDAEVQRLITLLSMKTNGYNIEARVTADGKVYLMEVAPRNGGNAHPQIVSLATDVSFIDATLHAALGDDCSYVTDAPFHGFWMSNIIHTNTQRIYNGINLDEQFEKQNLVSFTPYLEEGEMMKPYSGTNCSVGLLVATFKSRKEMKECLKRSFLS